MTFKYGEDEVLQEAYNYIASTYGGHYSQDSGIQLFDYWESLGILQPMAAGTAIKYLARFGKKDGHNKKDLLKAIHYTILLWYATYGKHEASEPDVDPDDDRIAVTDEGPIDGAVVMDVEEFLNKMFGQARPFMLPSNT